MPMEKNKLICYAFNQPVEGNSNLHKLFNNILATLNNARAVSSPKTFDQVKQIELHETFYNVCLCELYFHRVIKKLTDWKKLGQEYQEEFGSNWRYYAASKRMDFIREFGGEDEDYNSDGSIKTEVSDDNLRYFTIVNELITDGICIVTDTAPTDLSAIVSMIEADAKLNVSDMLFQLTGKEVPTYKKDADGNMIKQTWVDNALDKSVKSARADDLITALTGVVCSLRFIVSYIKSLDPLCDNKEFFPLFVETIDKFFNMDFIHTGVEAKNDKEV